MDTKTDNQITKDSIRDIESIGRMPIMSDSPSGVFLYKKAERLSIAIHLITNHLSDTEPSKWDARRLSVSLIESIIKYVRSESSDRYVRIRDVSDTVLSLLAIIETLGHCGIVSGDSAGIVRRELSLLVSMAQGELSSSRPSVSFNEKIFDIPVLSGGRPSVSKSARPRGKTETFVGSVGVASDITDKSVTDTPSESKKVISKKDSHDERTNAIVSLLRTKSDLTVKDFLHVTPGISEKTIQRELIKLVSAGVLKKQGERRWTRYSLVS